MALGLGLVVGVVVGLLGAGGSVLTVPVLILLLGLSATQATGTSLVVVTVVSGVGLLTHALGGRVSWRAGFGFAVTGVPAAIAGGYLAVLLSDLVITVVLAVLLLGTSVLMWRRDDGPDPIDPRGNASWIRILPTGFLTGLLTGTLGVGGGFIIVPALAALLGLSMPMAVGTSQLVLVMNAVAGLTGRAGTDVVAWTVGLVFAGGGSVGAVIASRLVGRLAPHRLSRFFSLLLALVAVTLVVEYAL